METKTILTIVAACVIFAIGGVVGCQGHAHFNPVDAVPLIGKSDTITIRDTVDVLVPYPVTVQAAGIATVTPRKASDSAQINALAGGSTNVPRETIKDDTPTLQPSGSLDIPITQKTYSTAEFRAVVSGWRPNLDSMTVYPKTTTITQERIVTKKPLLSITLGPTALYDGERMRAGIGVTAGFTVFSR